MDAGTPAARLRQAREAAGYESAAAFAEAIDATVSTYRAHENGTRNLTIPAAKQYAAHLGKSWQWLLFGDEAGVTAASELPAVPPDRSRKAAVGTTRIEEIDIKASAGGGTLIDGHQAVGEWHIPSTVLRGMTSTNEQYLKFISVVGDSMQPTLQPGQRMLVDVQDRSPSPPGIFVVWDGLGFVIKRIELVPHSEPLTVRIISDNPRYQPYERTLEEAYIQGRVIGGWNWI